MSGKNKYTVLIDGSRQVDVYADDFNVDGGCPEPCVWFWNHIPGQPDSRECDEVARFVLSNIVGFIDLGTQ